MRVDKSQNTIYSMTLFMILRALSIQYMLSLLQGIFPTQGSDPGLLNCRLILYHLSHQEIFGKSESHSVVSDSLQHHATPWTIQSKEFSRPEYCSGFPSPGDIPNPGIEPRSPTLQVDSLPAEPQGKPKFKRGYSQRGAPGPQ